MGNFNLLPYLFISKCLNSTGTDAMPLIGLDVLSSFFSVPLPKLDANILSSSSAPLTSNAILIIRLFLKQPDCSLFHKIFPPTISNYRELLYVNFFLPYIKITLFLHWSFYLYRLFQVREIFRVLFVEGWKRYKMSLNRNWSCPIHDIPLFHAWAPHFLQLLHE